MLDLGFLGTSLTSVNEISVNVKPEMPAIIFQLVATIGLFLIIRAKAWPGMKKAILARSQYINKQLDDAETMRAESAETKLQYETELNEVKNTKKDIFAQAEREAALQKEQIIAESKIRGREIIEKSRIEAEQSKEMIEAQIQKEMMVYVNEVAAKFISEKISDEEELKMIENAVAGLK